MGYKPSYAKTVKRTGPRDIALTEYSSSILSMIASGRATSRADLARTLNLAPSTITIKVNELMEAGLISESGSGSATGGRRPTLLELVPDAGFILAADLGAHHLWVGKLNLSGNLLVSEIRTIDINDGPEVVLPQAAAMMRALSDPAVDPPLRGVGMSLPGPVNFALGALDSPSRMRGWHEFKVRNWLAEEFGTLAVVDNDANMMALGEHTLRQRESPDSKVRQNTLFLKAGAAIGCGLIIDGQVYRGATGAAGDIAHVQIPAAGDAPCSCGNRGCLETVASGSAIIRDLAAVGIDAADVNDIVLQVNNGDPHTTTRVRTAGRILGQTLSIVVNFVNPDVVVLGGGLSQLEPYVAAVRSQLYESCHPLATKNIVIEASLAGSQAGLLGAGQLCLRTVLAS
ncbi:ROK family transcriptional regulator [Arthrobacter sp. efr-133-R2A-120]|uniref:ROK family transcriptional regulator n=1 Tax=unclassified Arthrobacter TaxID=235627 RepID=UPI002549F773|nr:ROK family transcriptional regulator [Arthrobacter sp. efr-133-R2A-120]